MKQSYECSRKIEEMIQVANKHGVFQRELRMLKEYTNLYRGHTQHFELSYCGKTPSFTSVSYGLM
jgi:hypothetical protein